MLRGSFCVSFWGWRVWGRTGKYLFSDTAAEAGILSIATPPVDVSENKYFPVLYNGFAGGGKRKGIGDREKDAMYGCAGMEDYRIW